MEQQLLEQQKKPNALAFQIALALSFYNLVLTFVLDKMGYSIAANVSMGFYLLSLALNYGPLIFAICYVQVKHKSELEGFISYGRAFSCGFKVALYAGLFTAFLIFLYYKILSPDSLDKIIDNIINMAAKTGNLEKFSEKMQPNTYLLYVLFGIAFGYAFVGVIISLITAAIVKKDRNNHAQIY